MKKDSVCFSHKKDDWETPQWLFDQLDKEYHFELDGAATPDNTKVANKFFFNSLGMSWGKMRIFLNPPYSKIKQFMKKAYDESLNGAIIVCLIPVRSDTQYWHDYVMKAHEIRLIRGRLKFGDSKTSAPFPSCVVIFDYNKYDKNNDPIFTTMDNKPK